MSAQDKVSVLRVAIVTDTDTPVYEYDFIPPTGRSVPPDRTPYLQQLVLHAALDNIDDQRWSSKDSNCSGYFKNLDRFGKMGVSAFVMAGGTVVLLLYGEGRFGDEHIRHFLFDVAEIYMKVILNPLHDPDEKVTSQSFHQQVLGSARRNQLLL
eukprot:jgi/Ulvmu1/2401/UM133_0002.1